MHSSTLARRGGARMAFKPSTSPFLSSSSAAAMSSVACRRASSPPLLPVANRRASSTIVAVAGRRASAASLSSSSRSSSVSSAATAAAAAAATAPPSPPPPKQLLVVDGRLARPGETRPSGQQGMKGLFKPALSGCPFPMGASVVEGSQASSSSSSSAAAAPDLIVNFAVFSSAATSVRLCLFSRADLDAGRTTAELELDPLLNRTGDVWHVMLEVEDAELMYGYRMSGPNQERGRGGGGASEDAASSSSPAAAAAAAAPGHRFDESVVLLDPYATSIIGRARFGELGPEGLDYGGAALGLARTWPQAACGLPCADAGAGAGGGGEEEAPFDWEGDRPLRTPMEDLVIYEMHVRGFTAHPSSGFRSEAEEAPTASSSPSPSSGPLRGTYSALTEKLDYVSSLGVNAIELLPVHEFNELEYYAVLPGSGDGEEPGAIRLNYWGYSTVAFFAPMARFSSAAAASKGRGRGSSSGRAVIREFKEMVKACHLRGIEVIMDVVFNHTAEGNEKGPSLSFRGIDNRVYYMLAPEGQYYNYSGCGNTLNCNHPTVRAFVVDCLRYWAEEMHVDGFRFDLASILTRAHSAWHPTEVVHKRQTRKGYYDSDDGSGSEADDDDEDIDAYDGMTSALATVDGGAYLSDDGYMSDGAGVATGTPLSDPPLVAAIAEDAVLRDVKLIAEAWDCDGLNQVGAFPHYGGRFSEWNGAFRDTVRAFVKGTDAAGTGTSWAANFASALCGSPNVYASPAGEGDWWGTVGGGARWRGGRGPSASVNFVCAHDGFTLRDLVSYNEKHNAANGEGSNDGEAHNLSWNCGFEGEGVLVAAEGGGAGGEASPPSTSGVVTPVSSPAELASVARLRSRQARNLAAALLLSHGVPMLHMGDEYGHSKGGNNNTYCHDSPLNWFDWAAAARDEWGLLRFQRALLRLRASRPELRRSSFVADGEVEWHGAAPGEPDWTDAARLVALSLRAPAAPVASEGGGGGGQGGGLYVAFSTAHVPITLSLPQWPGMAWRPLIDTAKPAPLDVLAPSDDEVEGDEGTKAALRSALSAAAAWTAEGLYSLLPWSMCVLESVPEGLVAAAAGNASSRAVEALMNASSVRLPPLRGLERSRTEGGAEEGREKKRAPSPSPSSSAEVMRAEIEAAAAENEKLRAALAEAAAKKK